MRQGIVRCRVGMRQGIARCRVDMRQGIVRYRVGMRQGIVRCRVGIHQGTVKESRETDAKTGGRMDRQVGVRAGRQASKQVWQATGYTCMSCPCCCFLCFTFLFCSTLFHLLSCFLFVFSFLSLQTDTAGHAYTVDSFSTNS